MDINVEAEPERKKWKNHDLQRKGEWTVAMERMGARERGWRCGIAERWKERRVRSEPWFAMRWICNTVLETVNINCLSFTMHGKL